MTVGEALDEVFRLLIMWNQVGYNKLEWDTETCWKIQFQSTNLAREEHEAKMVEFALENVRIAWRTASRPARA